MAKAYVKHDYAVTGRDYVDTEGGAGGGGVNYSAEEQDTGLKWLDGNTIYQTTFDTGTLPNNTTKTVAHGITDLNYVIEVRGFAKNPLTGEIIPLPYTASAGASGQVGVSFTATNIEIFTGGNLGGYTESWITLLYTKSEGE